MNRLWIHSQHHAYYQTAFLKKPLPNCRLVDDPDTANIVLGEPPLLASKITQLPALQWIQSTFAGIDALMNPSLRQDYYLTNIRDIFGPLIWEYVVGYALSYYREHAQYRLQQQKSNWQPLPHRSLAGKTLLILGTGSIGQYVAQQARHFGLNVHGVNRTGQSPSANFDATYEFDDITMAIAQADIIVSVLPATPETDNIIQARLLKHANNALFFNVGRGQAINENDLIVALNNGQLAHAYLDVFKTEPLNHNHPFWSHPNITITPHVAAPSVPEQVYEQFILNYQRWHTNQPLMNVIDFQKGY